MDACTACDRIAQPKQGRAAPLLFVGAVLACPCHLPITVGALTALGAGGIVAGNVGLLAGVLSALFLFFLAAGLVWLMRARDREVALEEHRARYHESTETNAFQVLERPRLDVELPVDP